MPVHVFVRWVNGELVLLLEIIVGDGSIWQFFSFPCFKNGVIHVGRRELDGSMLHHPVHSCITIQILELQDLTIIVGLVMYIITWL